MKKRVDSFAVILVMFCLPLLASAQIPNSGFEIWTGDTLAGWWVNNVAPLYSTISKSATAHGGSYAVRGDVASFSTQTVQPIIQTGVDARGFPYSQRPASFTGYYQFSPAASSGDRFGVNVVLYKGGVDGTPVGVAALALSTMVSSYTQFTAPFVYQTNDTPDTCVIQFQIVGPTAQQSAPTLGSYFLLDDIAFTGVSGVVGGITTTPTAFQLNQNYPNPFNPTTNVSFTVPSGGKATLAVFNLLGQKVSTLFDGPASPGRIYRAMFNASGLPSGIYFSRLAFAASGSSSRYMVLMRKMTLIK